MNKHVSPYIYFDRIIEGEVTHFRESRHTPGWAVAISTKEVPEEEDIKPALSDNRQLNDVKETPKDISKRFIKGETDKHFDNPEAEPDDDEDEDEPAEGGALFEDGKRYRYRKRKHRLTPSTTRQAYYPQPALAGAVFDMSYQRIVERAVSVRAGDEVDEHWLMFGVPAQTDWAAVFLTRIGAAVEAHPDIVEAYEAAQSRARQERYGVEETRTDSKVLQRKWRYSPSTKRREKWRLDVWIEYYRLNGSLEPLQTIFGKSDGILAEFPGDADGEGGERPEAKYPLDSTLQNRPSVQELAASWPAAKYDETRMTPVSRDCSHIMGPILPTREMKIPISGSVECFGFHKSVIPGLEDAARKSYGAFFQKQAMKYNRNWPRPKVWGDDEVDSFVGKVAKKELLHISEIDRTKDWHISRIGKLHFAPNGHLIKYGTWYNPMVDVPRNAKGAAFEGSADKKNPDDMARLGWEGWSESPNGPTRHLKLPAAEYAEQRRNNTPKMKEYRKSYHGNVEHVPCLDLYHERLRGPRKHCGPYFQKYPPLARDYAFGSKYTPPKEPADDVVERGSQLAAVNAMLSPQGLLVANVKLDDKMTQPKLGEMLWKQFRPGCKLPSNSTLVLLAIKAIEETENELRHIYQSLSA